MNHAGKIHANRRSYVCGKRRANLQITLLMTDGENTSGRPPDRVAREIFAKSEGSVRTYFVAFDTDPRTFGFLKDAGGDVLGAGTGEELRTALYQFLRARRIQLEPAPV